VSGRNPARVRRARVVDVQLVEHAYCRVVALVNRFGIVFQAARRDLHRGTWLARWSARSGRWKDSASSTAPEILGNDVGELLLRFPTALAACSIFVRAHRRGGEHDSYPACASGVDVSATMVVRHADVRRGIDVVIAWSGIFHGWAPPNESTGLLEVCLIGRGITCTAELLFLSNHSAVVVLGREGPEPETFDAALSRTVFRRRRRGALRRRSRRRRAAQRGCFGEGDLRRCS